MADQEARRQDYVRLISVSAHHMLDLVDGLSQGKVPQEAEDRFDLAAILNETLAMIAPDAAQKGTEIRAHIAPHFSTLVLEAGVNRRSVELDANRIVPCCVQIVDHAMPNSLQLDLVTSMFLGHVWEHLLRKDGVSVRLHHPGPLAAGSYHLHLPQDKVWIF